MPRDEIFVSYSHRDRRWLDELVITLAPLIRKRSITVWDDTKIGVGQKWKAEIIAALERAKVAVLFVTRNFLASEFIANEEMPRLLEVAKQAGLTVVWIAVGDSLYEETEITEYQAANDPAKPLNSLSEAEVDRELVRIAQKLNSLLLKPQSAEVAGAGDLKGTAAEATVPDTLLDQIVGNRIEQGAIARSREVIGSFAEDALTPVHRRLREELVDGKSAWRSIHALAGKAGVQEGAALEILRADDGVELGRAQSGKVIARLKTQVGA
ncbi:MAG: toll/interleukin-1 receptor domain-containing protein [Candidatus Solibacter sp.]|nr:toll/interleukin-1 receptor domain-containing protein [Candidatus Solibacter sp.]